jgi:hypothetical protein
MWLSLTLLGIILYILTTRVKRERSIDYKCFLMTLPTSKKRKETFLKSYDNTIPLEIIYGTDTKKIENISKFKHAVDPVYYDEAIRMHYDKSIKRPNITYMNMGAIGCYMGHMEFYKRCFKQDLKYAVIFEDNVIVKSPELYTQIQDVIDTMGDDFEMCFFHCLSRLPYHKEENDIERVKWISSTKCYLINVDNMRQYYKYFFPIDNHVDMKHEDIIAEGARVYYKDLRKYLKIDASGPSTIGHSDWGDKMHFSRQYPELSVHNLKMGY